MPGAHCAGHLKRGAGHLKRVFHHEHSCLGLLLAGTYALMAFGLNLQHGVARIMNLANGEMLMLGALAASWLFTTAEISPLLTLFVVAPLAFIGNWLIYRLLLRPLVRRAHSQGQIEVDSILATFGMSFALVGIMVSVHGEYFTYSFMADPLTILGTTVALNRFVAFVMVVLIGLTLYLWLNHSRLGMAVRAVAVSPQASGLVGINVPPISGIGLRHRRRCDQRRRRADLHLHHARRINRRDLHHEGADHRHHGHRRDRGRHTDRSGADASGCLSDFPAGASVPAAGPLRTGCVMTTNRMELPIAVILVILAACIPLVANGHWRHSPSPPRCMSPWQPTGRCFPDPLINISLATAAFFGIGGYLVATGMSDYEQPFWLMALIAPLVAVLIGLANLRLSGVCFVILTFGLAEMIRNVVSWIQNNFLGSRGLYVLTDFTEAHIYRMLQTVAAVVYFLGWILRQSRLGFALRIIGNDETVARHVGINTAWSKVVLFMTTGFVGALVGAIIAPRYFYIEPNQVFSPELSFPVVIMALLGGSHRLWGPLIGVVPFTPLWEVITIWYAFFQACRSSKTSWRAQRSATGRNGAPAPATKRPGCWRASGSRVRPTFMPRRSPISTRRAWSLPARWLPIRKSSCSTNGWPGSTRRNCRSVSS